MKWEDVLGNVVRIAIEEEMLFGFPKEIIMEEMVYNIGEQLIKELNKSYS